jgi:hypothetical protein
MIYVDSSVVLAHLFAEDTRPEPSFWERDDLVSSALAEYECWVRVHAYGRAETHGAALVDVLGRIDLLALNEATCARCRAPFPVAVRTLDAIHLAAADFLRMRGFVPRVASYDARLCEGAQALGLALHAL